MQRADTYLEITKTFISRKSDSRSKYYRNVWISLFEDSNGKISDGKGERTNIRNQKQKQ